MADGTYNLNGGFKPTIGAAGRFGWNWWTNGRFEEATDNAYLQADKVVVAPKVCGYGKPMYPPILMPSGLSASG